MKFNFKKISAITGSLLLAGMSVAIPVAAANYPAPFVAGGSADVAIVYGTGAGVSYLDAIHSGNIQTDLQSYMGGSGSGTGSSVTGGDSVQFTKASTKWQLGKSLRDVKSTSITDDDMPNLLADGTFTDDDNDDFDFTQKIQVANITLNMFEDNDYATDEPTVGIKISSGANVLNYTLDFTENPLFKDLPTTDLSLMGKTYYVLSVASTNLTLTLLDSAEDTILVEGETATISGHTVSVDFISSSEVILNIDGESTNTLEESETQKLSDGSYVGIKDILYNTKEGTLSSVEFSIGKGKLVLTEGEDVELNEDSVDDLSVSINGGGAVATTLTSIMIQWDADDELFITPDSEITMPGFETLKMSMADMYYPAEEELEVEHSGKTNMVLANFPLDDSTEDITLLEWDTTKDEFDLLGKDSDELLLSTNATNVTFDGDIHEWMPVSWSDGDDTQSILMRATSFKTTNSINYTTFQYRKDNAWVDLKKDATIEDDFTVGNIEITVGAIDKDEKTVNFWRGNSNMNFDMLYSAEGMEVWLPWIAQETLAQNLSHVTTNYADDDAACRATASTGNRQVMSAIEYNKTSAPTVFTTGVCAPAFVMIDFSEEDKDDKTGDGSNVTVTLGLSGTADEVDVVNISGTSGTSTEILDTDVFRNFVYSALATETLYDKTGTQETLKIIYHGSESYGEVFLTSPEASITAGTGASGATALGDILVKDTEVSSVATKNLIVVGGSCINSAAASLVGGAHCGAGWTTATGVGSGEFLIKSYSDSTITSKIALLVAGYNAADTVNAATYLRTQTVDTSKEYKGTSSTSASLVTTEVA